MFNTSVVAYSGLVMVMLGQKYRNDLVYRIEVFVFTIDLSDRLKICIDFWKKLTE